MKQKVVFIFALLLMAVLGAVAQTYKVTLPEGTEDAGSWTVSAGTNSAKGNVGLVGLTGGETITIEYTGTKKVRGVTAVKVAPDLAISVSSGETMEISYTGGPCQIDYTLNSSVVGKSISAVADVTWIKNFDYSTVGSVIFEVESQAEGASARTGKITLSYEGAADVVVTVNQEANIIEGAKSWKETALAEIKEGDVFVIVGVGTKTDNKYYAMSNDQGTSKAPSAVEVTVSGTEITSDVADNIKWNLTKTSEGYTFYPNEVTDKWLYCIGSNNGVRVGGNNTANVFDFKDREEDKTRVSWHYLQHKGTGRYMGVYGSQDWRCYTSVNSNISGEETLFYVYR